MNKIVTSQQAILEICKQIVLEKGFQGLNIRDVAKKSGISVGTVYNYYQTKSDLIIATIEAIWNDIMHGEKNCDGSDDFLMEVEKIFLSIQKGFIKYPDFFTAHSMSLASADKSQGKDKMGKYFDHMKKGLISSLNRDNKVKLNSFSESFTKEDFVDFIFTNLISLLVKQEQSCKFLLTIIKKAIY